MRAGSNRNRNWWLVMASVIGATVAIAAPLSAAPPAGMPVAYAIAQDGEDPVDPEEVDPEDPIPGETPCNVLVKDVTLEIKKVDPGDAGTPSLDVTVGYTLQRVNCGSFHTVSWMALVTGKRKQADGTDVRIRVSTGSQGRTYAPWDPDQAAPQKARCKARKRTQSEMGKPKSNKGKQIPVIEFEKGDKVSVSFTVSCSHTAACIGGCQCPNAGNKGVVTGTTSGTVP